MPFALLIIGIMLVTVSVRNTQDTFLKLVKGDFTGPGNFFYWVVILVTLGMIGNIQKLRPVADALLVLILVALVLGTGNPNRPGGGFFQKFTQALGTTTGGGAGVTIGLPRGSISA